MANVSSKVGKAYQKHNATNTTLYNIKRSTVTSRLKYGWDIERAITTPTKGVGSNQTTYKEETTNGSI